MLCAGMCSHSWNCTVMGLPLHAGPCVYNCSCRIQAWCISFRSFHCASHRVVGRLCCDLCFQILYLGQLLLVHCRNETPAVRTCKAIMLQDLSTKHVPQAVLQDAWLPAARRWSSMMQPAKSSAAPPASAALTAGISQKLSGRPSIAGRI